jgi:hypothetical protein
MDLAFRFLSTGEVWYSVKGNSRKCTRMETAKKASTGHITFWKTVLIEAETSEMHGVEVYS